MKFSLEICAYSSHSVSVAARCGAQRVELCSGRLEGGTTPSFGLLTEALKHKAIGVFPIIRPRGGDFCYTQSEFEEMLLDVEQCRKMGVHGIVTGVLSQDGQFDWPRMQQLKAQAAGLEFCVHRAIDMCVNPLEALEKLIDLGAVRVLSSGAQNTAFEGAQLLGEMQAIAGNRIEIMAGSGIQAQQIEALWKLGIRHFHASASGRFASEMEFRNPNIAMGKEGDLDEFTRVEAAPEKVEAMVETLRKLAKAEAEKA